MGLRGWLLFILAAGCMAALFGASACRKTNTLTNGGVVTFSNDTLKFDTVFTAAGSFTNWVVIYNPQAEAVVLSSVRLQNGTASYFHLNVDGRTGNVAANVKIAAHDSVYVFATVNIDPTIANTPFVINDALIATMNGKDFSVPIKAYGQNAHYIVSDSFGGAGTTTTWLTDKPYVVIHNCIVGPNVTLNIPRACRVYMHQDAQIIVYGALSIGQDPASSSDSVVFQGDRLDRAYFGYVGYPGEWCGFWFAPGSFGNISNTVMKNCGNGAAYHDYTIIPAAIRVDNGAKLNIDHSIIKNSISLGILGFQGNVTATNCLVNTTGGQALAVSMGGYDTFINCTFANYGSGQTAHANAGTVAILDWYTPDSKHYSYGDLNVLMRNCVVYGSLDSEMACDTTGSPAGTLARLVMDHCLVKMGSVREPFIVFDNTLFNVDPLFKSSATGDFHIGSNSPAAGTGGEPQPVNDLDYVLRTGSDIGCYQSK